MAHPARLPSRRGVCAASCCAVRQGRPADHWGRIPSSAISACRQPHPTPQQQAAHPAPRLSAFAQALAASAAMFGLPVNAAADPPSPAVADYELVQSPGLAFAKRLEPSPDPAIPPQTPLTKLRRSPAQVDTRAVCTTRRASSWPATWSAPPARTRWAWTGLEEVAPPIPFLTPFLSPPSAPNTNTKTKSIFLVLQRRGTGSRDTALEADASGSPPPAAAQKEERRPPAAVDDLATLHKPTLSQLCDELRARFELGCVSTRRMLLEQSPHILSSQPPSIYIPAPAPLSIQANVHQPRPVHAGYRSLLVAAQHCQRGKSN